MANILRIEGVEEILKKLDPAILQPVVTEGLWEIADIAKPEIESRTPRFSGLLAGSVMVQMDKWRVIPQYVKIGPTKPHTHLVELGVQPHFPPWRADQGKDARRLRRWVRQTLQPTPIVTKDMTKEGRKDAREAALDRATFLVARAIARRGIRGKFFLQAAFHATEQQLEGVVDGMIRHLEAEWDKIGGPVGK